MLQRFSILHFLSLAIHPKQPQASQIEWSGSDRLAGEEAILLFPDQASCFATAIERDARDGVVGKCSRTSV